MQSVKHVIQELIKESRRTFEGTAGDLTEEQLHRDPGGKALPIGAVYAHLILSEDMAITAMLQGKKPLYDTQMLNKTGVSAMMPAMDEQWAVNHEMWAKGVKVNLKMLREYSKMVYTQTDQYINDLTEEDMEKEIDLGPFGKMKVIGVLGTFIIGHSYSLAGEISALKGVFGAKGYPF